jgi:hypothetical protein
MRCYSALPSNPASGARPCYSDAAPLDESCLIHDSLAEGPG